MSREDVDDGAPFEIHTINKELFTCLLSTNGAWELRTLWGEREDELLLLLLLLRDDGQTE